MSITIYASNECGHGFISTSGLHLKVGGFSLQTFVALELISRSYGLHSSFTLKHCLRFYIFRLLSPEITGHVIASHGDHCFRFDISQQNAPSEVWILFVFYVEHDGPAPQLPFNAVNNLNVGLFTKGHSDLNGDFKSESKWLQLWHRKNVSTIWFDMTDVPTSQIKVEIDKH